MKQIGDFILTIDSDDEDEIVSKNKNKKQEESDSEEEDADDEARLDELFVSDEEAEEEKQQPKNSKQQKKNKKKTAKQQKQEEKDKEDEESKKFFTDLMEDNDTIFSLNRTTNRSEGNETAWAPLDEEEVQEQLFDETQVFEKPAPKLDSDDESDDSSDDEDEEEVKKSDEKEVEEIAPPKFGEDRLKSFMESTKKNKNGKLDEDEQDELERKDFDKSFFKEDTNKTREREFNDMNLSRPLLKAVDDMGFSRATPIQSRCIPLLLKGLDICASASTGSGKTAAFLLPVLERLLFRNKSERVIRVLILLPTRELARQCFDVICKLTKYTDIQSCVITGGKKLQSQIAALNQRPEIVIGTPGRIVDHLLNSQGFGLETIEILILDEADRLLEMGFKDELKQIVNNCPSDRQTILFSATMTDDVTQLVSLSLKNPVRVVVDERSNVVQNLKQEFVRLKDDDEYKKQAILLSLCTRTYRTKTIIFCNYKTTVRNLRIVFYLKGLKAAELHADISQSTRLKELDSFASGKVDFLICTDLAARGLDVKDVDTVINYDLPSTLKTYIHRVGRTARAGRDGVAVSFASDENRILLKKVVKRAKTSGEDVLQRVIPPEAIQYWREKIEKLKPEIKKLKREIQMNKQLLRAHKELEETEEKLTDVSAGIILHQPDRKHLAKTEELEKIRKETDQDFRNLVESAKDPKNKKKRARAVLKEELQAKKEKEKQRGEKKKKEKKKTRKQEKHDEEIDRLFNILTGKKRKRKDDKHAGKNKKRR